MILTIKDELTIDKLIGLTYVGLYKIYLAEEMFEAIWNHIITSRRTSTAIVEKHGSHHPGGGTMDGRAVHRDCGGW